MKTLVLLLVWAVLLICVSCGASNPEKKYHGWGFSWENDSTLVQYLGNRVCTLRVDRENYEGGILGYYPDGSPIVNRTIIADTVHTDIDTLEMRDSIVDAWNKGRIGE